MTSSWIFRVGFGVGVLALAMSSLASACKGKDCADERIGQRRCVGNRLETCGPNNELSYDSCTDNPGIDKYCSAVAKACVTKEIYDAQTASSTGASTSSTASGTGGMGAGGDMTATVSSTVASTVASTAEASSTAMSSSAATGAGDITMPLNGCDPASMSGPSALTDYTANPSPIVLFSGGAYAYTPACIRIKAGQSVLFVANGSTFEQHPLSGGLIDNANVSFLDTVGPIKATKTGTTATFTFPDTGAFGFYCDFHYAAGMKGAVYVEP